MLHKSYVSHGDSSDERFRRLSITPNQSELELMMGKLGLLFNFSMTRADFTPPEIGFSTVPASTKVQADKSRVLLNGFAVSSDQKGGPF